MTSPQLIEMAKRAEEIQETRYIYPDERGHYEAQGWEVKDSLGHHGAHALLAIRRIK